MISIYNYNLVTIIRCDRRTALCILFAPQTHSRAESRALVNLCNSDKFLPFRARQEARRWTETKSQRFTNTRERVAPCTAETTNTATATGGRPPGTPEPAVSRSIWDKVRRFCAPRFAETPESRSHGEPAALSLRPFFTSAVCIRKL